MSDQRSTGGRRPNRPSSQSSSRPKRPSQRNTNITRGGSSGRSGSGRSASGGTRRSHRRKRYNWPVIITYAVILLALICGVVFGLSRCSRDPSPATADSTETTELQELNKKVTVEGISIARMTKAEARAAVLEGLGWSMKAEYDGSTYELANLLEAPVDAVLETIFEGGKESAYTLDISGLDDAISAEVGNMGEAWDVPAKDAAIYEYDAASNKFLFSDEASGRIIDREKLAADIRASMDKKDYSAVITVEGKECQPELTKEEAKAQYRIIGSFETTTTSNKDRNTNIRLAAEAINGTIIPKGGTFSINDCTGERTYEKGYRPAGAYVNGVLVEEPGGGVCQVSSTLYNAVIFSGLNTTERYAHSYEPSYVNPGEDAMISFPNLDMKFENTTIDSVGILAEFANQKLKISVYGIPVLEEGVTLEMRSELTETMPLDPPTYEEDPTLQPGEEVTVKAGTAGTKYVTYLITKKNGEVVNQILLHNSRYKGKAPVIRRNSTGIAPVTEPSSEGESGSIQDGTLDTVITGSGATLPENTETTAAQNQGPSQTPQETTQAQTTEPTEAVTQAAGPGTESTTGSGPASPITTVEPR